MWEQKGIVFALSNEGSRVRDVMMIKKNNIKGKDRRKDAWFSTMRSPYESVFSNQNKQIRYRGLEKVQFQVSICALVFNLKRVVALGYSKNRFSVCLE